MGEVGGSTVAVRCGRGWPVVWVKLGIQIFVVSGCWAGGRGGLVFQCHLAVDCDYD